MAGRCRAARNRRKSPFCLPHASIGSVDLKCQIDRLESCLNFFPELYLWRHETCHAGCDQRLEMIGCVVCKLGRETPWVAVPMSPSSKTLRRLKGFVFVH
jgi:hypothetical protein